MSKPVMLGFGSPEARSILRAQETSVTRGHCVLRCSELAAPGGLHCGAGNCSSRCRAAQQDGELNDERSQQQLAAAAAAAQARTSDHSRRSQWSGAVVWARWAGPAPSRLVKPKNGPCSSGPVPPGGPHLHSPTLLSVSFRACTAQSMSERTCRHRPTAPARSLPRDPDPAKSRFAFCLPPSLP
jgi:hypothetical protein